MIDKSNRSRNEWEMLIYQYVFDEFDRKLLKYKLLDNLTIETIAEKFGYSSKQIQRRLAKAKAKFFIKIECL